MRGQVHYASLSPPTASAWPALRESPPSSSRPVRLLDQVRAAIRMRHFSRRTERAYVAWIRRFILFNGKRHPLQMGEIEVTRFLSFLAVKNNVSPSTQNQALCALLFLYREVLDREMDWLDEIVRAKRPRRLPVVMSREEVASVLHKMDGAGNSTAGTSRPVGAGLRCPTHWRRSTRTLGGNGAGSGSFPPAECTAIARADSDAGITVTNRPSSEP
ncbi:MAG: hypothetical protein DMF49_12670 [Acidobacteria bacterium]|nr:MAG: hypothetical protein DMF49_12670 [Acidobacteriota bacterium]